MTTLYTHPLTDFESLIFRGQPADVVTWQGRRALRLNGLVIVPDLTLDEGSLEVLIGSNGTAYPGLVFRAADVLNYELAYAQPHTSGQWDALQYDPVFHGINTWQLHHGAGAQQVATVLTGSWFTFKVDFKDEWAIVRVDDQPPLVVPRLAHSHRSGLMGIWTYLPAHFCNLRVADQPISLPADFLQADSAVVPPGTVTEWFLEGFGQVTCERSGILNLNRYLPSTVNEARLTRQLEILSDEPIAIEVGFSDELTLYVDDHAIFTGQHVWHDSPNWAERGYVAPIANLEHTLTAGIHTLTAKLKMTEPFGWGMRLSVRGGQFSWLPAELG